MTGTVAELRIGMAQHLEQHGATVAVTLVYNDVGISVDRIRADLRTVHGRLDRRLYGPRYHLRAASQRSRWWAVAEMIADYPHVHVGWTLHGDQVATLSAMLDAGLWRRCAPGGTWDVQPYRPGWAGYAVKALTTSDHVIFDHTIVR